MLEVVSNDSSGGKFTELTRRKVARHSRSLQEGIAAAEACFAWLVAVMTSGKLATHHAARGQVRQGPLEPYKG